ncbi:unnamed protein product [Urochloa humidicola]
MAAAATSGRVLTLAAAAVLFLAVCLQSPSPAVAEGTRYTVGGAEGWRAPPPETKDRYYHYTVWASNFTFYVDDSLEFVYKNDSVIKVSKAGYYHCNETDPSAAPPRDGTTLFVLDAPGPAYFASADRARCVVGERLMLDVLAAAAPGPWSPPSWAPSPGPSAQHHHSAAAAQVPSSAACAAVAAVLAMA